MDASSSRRRTAKQRRQEYAIVRDICAFLRLPSPSTARAVADWERLFACLYGDIGANLSGNGKLHADALLAQYGLRAEIGRESETLRRLFFAIQTYFSLLIKCITAEAVSSSLPCQRFSARDIITGDFAKCRGVTNYGADDCFGWPLYEWDNGFDAVFGRIRQMAQDDCFPIDGRMKSLHHDDIRRIYEAVIPKALRHALGEYYTPDWLAAFALHLALQGRSPQEIRVLSLVDPTCGAGTFLCEAIALKRQQGATAGEILATVRGIDINPLAVLTAKTNYLLAILDLLDGASPVTLPIAQADLLTVFEATDEGSVRRSPDEEAVRHWEPCDLVIGNPPWINWEYLPPSYRRDSLHWWTDYGLVTATGRTLSFLKEDISVLITAIAAHRLLLDGGTLAFVLRRAMLKSSRNGAAFRRFTLPDRPLKVIRVDDLSRIPAFDGTVNSTVLLLAQKGEETVYPVPYYRWDTACRHASEFRAPLSEILSRMTVTEQCAFPSAAGDPSSPWCTTDSADRSQTAKILGANPYRARTGVFTGGANAVYWLAVHCASGGYLHVTNLTARTRRKVECVSAALESEFIYPMLKGSGIGQWRAYYDTYLLCPHTAATKLRPVPQEELAAAAPLTMAYLRHFRPTLDRRKGFAGWEQEIRREEFHAVLRVGAYTFAPYKVVWRYIASDFVCAVIGSVEDPFLGQKLLLPNEKVMFIATDDEAEAYYLCGVLSAAPVTACIKSYMNPTSISTHILDKLRIPPFDPDNPLHRAIADCCKAGHEQERVLPYLTQINGLVATMYGL